MAARRIRGVRLTREERLEVRRNGWAGRAKGSLRSALLMPRQRVRIDWIQSRAREAPSAKSPSSASRSLSRQDARVRAS